LRGELSKGIETRRKCLSFASIETQAVLHAGLAEWCFSHGKPEQAREYEKETQALCTGLEPSMPLVLLSLSRLNLMRGDVHASEKQFFDAQIESPKQLGEGSRLDFDLHRLNLYSAKGELGLAESLADELRDRLGRNEPKPLAYASVLNMLGSISQLRAESDEAETLHTEARKLAERLEAPLVQARSLAGLANVNSSRFDAEKALAYLDQAAKILNRCEYRVWEHALRVQRADLLSRTEKDVPQGLERISDLLVKGYRYQCLSLDLQAMISLGILIWHERQDPQTALSYFEDAMEQAEGSGQRFLEILARGLTGSVLHDQGEYSAAERLLKQALLEMEQGGLDIDAKCEFAERYHDLTGLSF
jgi:tetratricopeptide (TPR) repeat protein